MSEIKIIANMLQANEEITVANEGLLNEKGIFTINLMSSPGSGKTSLLEKVLPRIKDSIGVAVIEGDIYTSKDAERIGVLGVPAVQINTGGACHLDARMIRKALEALNLDELDLLVIENVGNLVCPAEFDIGEDMKVTVVSTAEGNDKVLKYPLMFEKSEAVILNKTDLIGLTNFSREEFYRDMKAVNANARIFEASCLKETGMDEICEWIKSKVTNKKKERLICQV